jgi:hypothetical protein
MIFIALILVTTCWYLYQLRIKDIEVRRMSNEAQPSSKVKLLSCRDYKD